MCIGPFDQTPSSQKDQVKSRRRRAREAKFVHRYSLSYPGLKTAYHIHEAGPVWCAPLAYADFKCTEQGNPCSEFTFEVLWLRHCHRTFVVGTW